jgi:hypothetical protein
MIEQSGAHLRGLARVFVVCKLAGCHVVDEQVRAGSQGGDRAVCFKVNVLVNGVLTEIGDGGFTDWTAKLLASRKERLLISGYGLDQIVVLIDDEGSRT